MSMPHPVGEWTAAMLAGLPDDGRRYEIVDGELLVTPAPSWAHQRAVRQLFMRLHSYLDQHGIGEAIMAPADVELDFRTVVEPDLFVVPSLPGVKPGSYAEAERLLLAVEVLSPSTARADRQIKRRRYQDTGVAEYWIVDLDARLIERWRPDDERPAIISETLEWAPVPTLSPISIDLPRLFAEALDT